MGGVDTDINVDASPLLRGSGRGAGRESGGNGPKRKIRVEPRGGGAPTTATDLAAGATGDAPAGPERRRGTGARGADPPAAAVREEGVVRADEAAGGRCGGRRGGAGTTPRRPPRAFSRPPEPQVPPGGVERSYSPLLSTADEQGRRGSRATAAAGGGEAPRWERNDAAATARRPRSPVGAAGASGRGRRPLFSSPAHCRGAGPTPEPRASPRRVCVLGPGTFWLVLSPSPYKTIPRDC